VARSELGEGLVERYYLTQVEFGKGIRSLSVL